MFNILAWMNDIVPNLDQDKNVILFFYSSLSLSLSLAFLYYSQPLLSSFVTRPLSLSLSLSHVLGPPVSLIEPPILLLSSAAVVVWIFFFGYRGMDRDRLQWVFDDGGFANTVSLDLVVVFNLSPSHFFSNSVVLGWAWLAMGGGLHCSLWVYVCSLGLGWFWWCFVGGYGWWSRWFWVVVMKEALVIGF